MPNIYITISKIKALLDDKALLDSKKQFIQELLEGNKQHLGLIKLAQQPTFYELSRLEQELLKHYASIHSLNWVYKRHIKSILQDISELCQFASDILQALGMNKTKDAFFHYAVVHDRIYELTDTKYSGTLMLPILQCMDIRLAKSEGECSGYVMVWLLSFLHNSKPFGISFLEAPPFKAITLNSKVGRRYPDLNHGAPLTQNIANLQKIHYLELIKGFESGIQGRIYMHSESVGVIQQDAALLAKNILASIQNNPDCGYYLSFRNFRSGHALGAYQDKKGMFHFLDVNCGWFRFNKINDWLAWLPFYICAMNYNKKYYCFQLFQLGFQEKKDSLLDLTLSTAKAIMKHDVYLRSQQIKKYLHCLHGNSNPEKFKPVVFKAIVPFETSKDDGFKITTKLTEHDAILASIIHMNNKDFQEARIRSQHTFFREDCVNRNPIKTLGRLTQQFTPPEPNVGSNDPTYKKPGAGS